MNRSANLAAVRPEVLAVASFCPFPETRGDPVRVMQILRGLHSFTRLTVVLVDSNGGDVQGLQRALPNAEVLVAEVDRLRGYRKLPPVGRYLLTLVTGWPVWITLRRSKQVRAILRDRSRRVGLAICFGEASAGYSRSIAVPWIWDKFNVLSSSVQFRLSEARSRAEQVAALLDLFASRRFEKRFGRRASRIWVTNPEERERATNALIGSKIDVLPSAVMLPPHAIPIEDLATKRVVWLGNMTYSSNFAGLLHFLEQGWPSLANRGWILDVVGSGVPSPEVHQVLNTTRGVQFHGLVEDLSSVFRTAIAGVVPIWSGGGTKMKTLTMLAHGLPVVSTPLGAEGISMMETGCGLVAESSAGLVEHLLHLNSDIAARRRMSILGREVVATQFSLNTIEQRLKVLLDCEAGA